MCQIYLLLKVKQLEANYWLLNILLSIIGILKITDRLANWLFGESAQHTSHLVSTLIGVMVTHLNFLHSNGIQYTPHHLTGITFSVPKAL